MPEASHVADLVHSAATSRLRILIADDHRVLREELSAFLTRKGFEVVAEAANATEALRQARKLRPDIILLDYRMPGKTGIEAARDISREVPGTRIILLTTGLETQHLLEALRAGIDGYVMKMTVVEELPKAIREAAKGHLYLPPRVCRAVVSGLLALVDSPSVEPR